MGIMNRLDKPSLRTPWHRLNWLDTTRRDRRAATQFVPHPCQKEMANDGASCRVLAGNSLFSDFPSIPPGAPTLLCTLVLEPMEYE